mmetsp:Transcript_27327/g.55094  ORF Transcript_27327/g.55094 Transcript_27327/m.55094 type:complete len:402 (-) Transcript_27327:1528-2733(-)
MRCQTSHGTLPAWALLLYLSVLLIKRQLPKGDDDELRSATISRGKVYVGGNPDWLMPLAASLFPETTDQIFVKTWENYTSSNVLTEDDILFLGYNPCRIRLKHSELSRKRGYPWKVIGTSAANSAFPGRVMWLVNEPRTHHVDCGNRSPLPDTHVMIGPYPNGSSMEGIVSSDRTMLVYFAAVYLWAFPADVRDAFLDPAMTVDAWRQMSKIAPSQRGGIRERDRFAAYVASHCVDFREEAVARISNNVQTVHAGGACSGNGTAVDHSHDTKARSKIRSLPSFFQAYRFAIVFENTYESAYITEKIVNAYLGGAIPIYYGTEDVFNIFSKDSFVYYNMSDPGPAIALIQHLESNKTAYEEMILRPIFTDGRKTIEDYFSFGGASGGKLKEGIRELLFRQNV